MKFTAKVITPAIAVRYLKKNTGNRNLNPNLVAKYARDLESGKWKKDTGETIKISRNGQILDGQHRLAAIIKSGKSFPFHIATDVDEAVFDVIDTGLSRGSADIFQISGVANYALLSAAILTYTTIKNGYRHQANANVRPTPALLLELYYKRQKFWQTAALRAVHWYTSFAKIIPTSLLCGLYAVFYDIDPEDAATFFERLATGEDVKIRAISMLRNKLLQDRLSPRRLKRSIKNALIIKTWNLFRTKEEIKALVYDPDREDFPKPL